MGNTECLYFLGGHTPNLTHIVELPADFMHISYCIIPPAIYNAIFGNGDLGIPDYKITAADINRKVPSIGEQWSIDVLLEAGAFPETEGVFNAILEGKTKTKSFALGGSNAEPEKVAAITRRILTDFEPADLYDASGVALEHYAMQPVEALRAMAESQKGRAAKLNLGFGG